MDRQTFLCAGTSFEGRILVTGVVHLDGHFKGDGLANGTLVVGESGVVEADLDVETLIIHGTFSGKVTARERVEVGPTGRVAGEVATPILQVEDGAQLTAAIRMGKGVAREAQPDASTAAAPIGPALQGSNGEA